MKILERSTLKLTRTRTVICYMNELQVYLDQIRKPGFWKHDESGVAFEQN